jgi:hypothetical protein
MVSNAIFPQRTDGQASISIATKWCWGTPLDPEENGQSHRANQQRHQGLFCETENDGNKSKRHGYRAGNVQANPVPGEWRSNHEWRHCEDDDRDRDVDEEGPTPTQHIHQHPSHQGSKGKAAREQCAVQAEDSCALSFIIERSDQ